MKEYKKISSEVYEFTKPVGSSLSGDLEYYYQHIKDLDGYILEAGVGTGRLLIPYLQKGLKLDGVDLSKDMLNICKQNLKKHKLESNLYLQNLKDLKIDRKYQAIIMPTGSFCLITDLEQVFAVLKSFKSHLAPEGKLILDISFPSDFIEGEKTYIYKTSEKENIILSVNNLYLDYNLQRRYSINRYEKWVDDKLIDSEIAEFNLNWYGIREFTYMLKEIGFKNIQYEENYGLKEDIGLVTFICQI